MYAASEFKRTDMMTTAEATDGAWFLTSSSYTEEEDTLKHDESKTFYRNMWILYIKYVITFPKTI